MVVRAKKLEKKCDVSRVQQTQFTSMQNRPNSVAIENKQKTWAGVRHNNS